jgi:cyclic nucleotide gated channel alpha 3
VVDPSSDGYYRWLAVISIAVLYNLLVVIARAVFWQLQDSGGLSVWFSLDYICDAIYLADMFVQFRTGNMQYSVENLFHEDDHI